MTFIGFCWHEIRAYCKRCNKTYKYGYNSAGGGSGGGDFRCPICHTKEFADIETDDFAEMHLQMVRGLIRSNITNDEQKKRLRKEVNEILKIQRIWMAEKEQEEKEFHDKLRKDSGRRAGN